MATTSEINAFIKKLGALAVAESNRRIAAGQGFVLPSVCIAQSALETGWGSSGLMTRANAYFGIKAGGSWTGAVYTADTWEVANGEAYNTSANFRAYSSLADSVKDYYDLIGNNSRYSNALSFGTDQSAWKSPRQCITAIWSGGYATDTLYVEKIMSTINARNLAEYDKLIDGVSVGTQYVQPIVFKKSDLLQGKLIATDSNRSVGLSENANFVSLKWEKAITIETAAQFRIVVYDSYANKIASKNLIYLVQLLNDVPKISGNGYNSASLSVMKWEFEVGTKIAFNIGNATNGQPLSLNDINDDFAIEIIQETFTGDTISTDETFKTPIAHFVKIE